MNQQERVAIFIDGSNFYHSVKAGSIRDTQIDFRKLTEILRSGRLLTGVYYYNAPLDRGFNEEKYWKQQSFLAELRAIPGFHVIMCRMKKIKNPDGTFNFYVKGDDIHLATDMISLAYENVYDTAVLVSGDGDFEPAIKQAQKLGKKVENAYFEVSRSDFLRVICNSSTNLSRIIPKCLKENKK